MRISFNKSTLFIDGHALEMPWEILDAADGGGKVFVLFDPDSYLLDPNYKKMRRSGLPAIKNLIAYAYDGSVLWSADLPAESDYYYKIISIDPLIVNSFSSFACKINTLNGSIEGMNFFK